jgi:hypothetical protein
MIIFRLYASKKAKVLYSKKVPFGTFYFIITVVVQALGRYPPAVLFSLS